MFTNLAIQRGHHLAGHLPRHGDSPGFDGNFTPLREDHLSCRETLPQKKQARSYSESPQKAGEPGREVPGLVMSYIAIENGHLQ